MKVSTCTQCDEFYARVRLDVLIFTYLHLSVCASMGVSMGGKENMYILKVVWWHGDILTDTHISTNKKTCGRTYRSVYALQLEHT